MDFSMADGIATRQVPEFSVVLSAALTAPPPLLLAVFWLPCTENLPKTSYPLFSLNSKETGGDKNRCSPPSLLFTVAPHQRSSVGVTNAKFMGSTPGLALCGPDSFALYQMPAEKMLPLGCRWWFEENLYLLIFPPISLCAHICYNFTRKKTSFSPTPSFTHSFTYFYYLGGFQWRRHVVVIKDYRNE